MATRLTSTFTNLNNESYTINIDDSDYMGSPITVNTAGAGFSLKYEGRDMLDAIQGSSARIQLAVEPSTKTDIESLADDILTAVEERFTVEIQLNSTLYWVGYVLPDLSGFQDLYTSYEYQLTATDGLARLKGIEYKDDSVNPAVPYGQQAFLTTILNILNQGVLASTYFNPTTDIFLRTSVNWTDGIIGAPSAAKCPFVYSRVNGEFVYAERKNHSDEWKFPSCYDVLKMILEHWQASIRFSNGCYRIQQLSIRETDLFYERRFASDETLISSTANAGYDIQITQAARARFAGGVFAYLPPLKEVEAVYQHNTTLTNYIANPGQRWYKNAPNTQPLNLNNIDLDSQTYFRVSGVARIDVSASNTTPWRYILGMSITKGGESIESGTAPGTDGSGNNIPIVKRDPITWDGSGTTYYEISTSFSTANDIIQYVHFNFVTPSAPSSGTQIRVNFTTIGGEKLDGTTQGSVTVNYWAIESPTFEIVDANFLESENSRAVYTSENPDTGNSDREDYDMKFGHAVAKWTPIKIQTSSNLVLWQDTTATWDRDTETEDMEFGELWSQQRMALQLTPVLTWRGQIKAAGTYAHTRFIFPDNTPFCMIYGEYSAADGVWSGEWVKTGINEFNIVRGVKYEGGISPTIKTGLGTPNGIVNPGSGTSGPSGVAEVAMAALATNYLGTTVSSGSVVSIDLSYAVNANSYLAGDDILIYDPGTGSITPLTVSSTANSGDTTLSVTGTADVDIAPGSYILYSPFNHFTTQGGGGSGVGLPSGTDKYTLRHNGTSWVASSLLQNDGTTVAVGTAPSSSYLLYVKQTGLSTSTNGIAVENAILTRRLRMYHDGSATLYSEGGNNLKLLTDTSAQIVFSAGGGGGQISQYTFAPASNVTSVFGGSGMSSITGTYAPTTSGGDFAIFRLGSAINQTGTSDQVVRGLSINPTLTSVAVEFRGVAYIPSSQVFLYQPNGTSVKSHLIGNMGIGTGTTTPAAKIDIVGNGATSSTHSLLVANSTPTTILAVRDDQRVGILTSSPSLTLDAITATDGIGLPTGTTAQRPSVNSSLRLNSTVAGLEVRNGGAWHRLTCAVQPSIAAGAAAGTGPTVNVTLGNDLCHALSITTGTSATTGTLATITFNQALDAGLFTCVVFSPTNANAAGEIAKFYIGSTGNTSYTISCAAAPTDATTYTFNILVKQ